MIHSLHKTLPAMTQTALLHKKEGRVSEEKLEEFLDIYETSSPSYILMGGISYCLRYVKEQGQEQFGQFWEYLQECRKVLGKLRVLRLIGKELTEQKDIFDFDCSKIVISTAGADIDGPRLHELLRKRYHLEMEMEAEQYILALTSVADSREGFQRLTKALLEIDRELAEKHAPEGFCFIESCQQVHNERVYPVWKAMESPCRKVPLEGSIGKISAEYVYLYPPGIPLLVPGERISPEFFRHMEELKLQGLTLQGMKDYSQNSIYIVEERKNNG